MKAFLAAYAVLCLILPVALSAPFDRHDRGTLIDVDNIYERYDNGEVGGFTATFRRMALNPHTTIHSVRLFRSLSL
jgi:hypothetical protein